MKTNPIRRITLLLLVFALSTGVFAVSCTEQTPDDTASAADVFRQETAAETSEYVLPDIDYEGKDFIVSSNEWLSSPWRINKYVEVYAETETGDPVNDAIYHRNRKAEEELNINIRFYPIESQSSTKELTTPILASEDAYAFALPNGTSLPTIVGAGDMLYNLNSINSLDLDASWWDHKSAEELNLFGSLYMVTGDLCFYTLASSVVIYFNKSLVSDNNLESPYESVYNGTWTIDRFFEMAEGTARDINGDSKMTEDDIFGLSCYDETNNMLYSCGVRISERDADGNISIIFNNDRSADIIDRVTEFVRNKSICMYASDYTSGHSNVFFEVLMKCFSENKALFFSQQLLVALDLRDMEADFGILPYPKYNEEQKQYHSSGNASWQTFVIVPVTNSDLDMTGTVLNAMGYYSQQFVVPAFVDTTIYNKTLRDEDSEKMLDIIFDNIVFDIAFYYNWGDVFKNVYSMINDKKSFTTVYAANESRMISALEDTIAMFKGK